MTESGVTLKFAISDLAAAIEMGLGIKERGFGHLCRYRTCGGDFAWPRAVLGRVVRRACEGIGV